MGRFFYTAETGEKYRVDLLPLSAYEADGGCYDDSGNGGENMLATGDPREAVATYCYACGETTSKVSSETLAACAAWTIHNLLPIPHQCPRCGHDLSDVLMPYRMRPDALFTCAVTAAVQDGDDWDETATLQALEAMGIESYEFWHDSACGWYLLRGWPAVAPLEARIVG